MIQNNILKLMWGILKLKVGNFETGSNLSYCDPFVSNQQLEPQGFIFKTYIINCTEKKGNLVSRLVFFANTPPNMISV